MFFFELSKAYAAHVEFYEIDCIGNKREILKPFAELWKENVYLKLNIIQNKNRTAIF